METLRYAVWGTAGLWFLVWLTMVGGVEEARPALLIWPGPALLVYAVFIAGILITGRYSGWRETMLAGGVIGLVWPLLGVGFTIGLLAGIWGTGRAMWRWIQRGQTA